MWINSDYRRPGPDIPGGVMPNHLGYDMDVPNREPPTWGTKIRASDWEDEDAKGSAPDYVLEESQHILVDYLGLLAKRKTLTASNPASRN
jgi:hypothetical protein